MQNMKGIPEVRGINYDKIEGKYVEGLNALKSIPEWIWYRGVWNALSFGKCAAVVGSRRMTEYGRQVVAKLTNYLVSNGWTVVSGFMYGVDKEAHRQTVEKGGKTIAVLGWGIAERLDKADEELIGGMLKLGGLVVSEWEKKDAEVWTFPQRNRIVAAIASDIFVVEAGEKSGSLITADWGRKLGKKVWAVPGPVTSKVSVGTNKLISSGKAVMWLPDEKLKRNAVIDRSTDKTNLYILLQNEPLSMNDLVRKTNRDPGDLGGELTMMTLKGEIKEKEGKYYLC